MNLLIVGNTPLYYWERIVWARRNFDDHPFTTRRLTEEHPFTIHRISDEISLLNRQKALLKKI